MANAGVQAIAKLLQARRPWVGPLEFDCSIAEDHAVEVDVTDNPVESLPGLPGSVTDHAVVRPRVVQITALVSATPDRIIGTASALSPTRHLRLWRRLRDLALRRELVSVITTLEVYPSMMLVRVGTPRTRDRTGVVEIQCTAKQVLFASVPGAAELSEAAAELAQQGQDVGAQTAQGRHLAELQALL